MLEEEIYHQRAQVLTEDYKKAKEKGVQGKFVIRYQRSHCFASEMPVHDQNSAPRRRNVTMIVI